LGSGEDRDEDSLAHYLSVLSSSRHCSADLSLVLYPDFVSGSDFGVTVFRRVASLFTFDALAH
jgi:hypothetical protein